RRRLSIMQNRQKVGLLLQSLLQDRFQLKVTHDKRELPIYALVVGKNGPKLHEARPGDTYPDGLKGTNDQPIGHGDTFQSGRGALIAQGIPIQTLIDVLSFQLGRTISDQTGFRGKYDFNLRWTPDEDRAAVSVGQGRDANGLGAAALRDSS